MSTLAGKTLLITRASNGIGAAPLADPLDRELVEIMLASEALLDRDRFCQRYAQAFRETR